MAEKYFNATDRGQPEGEDALHASESSFNAEDLLGPPASAANDRQLSRTEQMEASDREAKELAALNNASGTARVVGIDPREHRVPLREPGGLKHSLADASSLSSDNNNNNSGSINNNGSISNNSSINNSSFGPRNSRGVLGAYLASNENPPTTRGLGRGRNSRGGVRNSQGGVRSSSVSTGGSQGGGSRVSGNSPPRGRNSHSPPRASTTAAGLSSGMPSKLRASVGAVPSRPGAYSAPNEPPRSSVLGTTTPGLSSGMPSKLRNSVSVGAGSSARSGSNGGAPHRTNSAPAQTNKGFARPHSRGGTAGSSMYSGAPNYYGRSADNDLISEPDFNDSIVSLPGAQSIGSSASRNDRRREKFDLLESRNAGDEPAYSEPGLSGTDHNELRRQKFGLANPATSDPTDDNPASPDLVAILLPGDEVSIHDGSENCRTSTMPASAIPSLSHHPPSNTYTRGAVTSVSAPLAAEARSFVVDTSNPGEGTADAATRAAEERQTLGRDASARNLPKLSRAKKWFGVGIFAIILVVVVIVVVIIIVGKGEDNLDGSSSPTNAPGEILPRPESIDMREFLTSNILANVTVEELRLFDDASVSTPQRLSWNWMLDDPMLRHYSSSRLSQRFALVTLYHAAGGENWKGESSWLDYASHECSWSNLVCDGSADARNYVDGLVKEVRMLDNNANGILPVEISLLPFVETIILTRNDLGGSIPSEIGFLTLLRELALNENKLEGELPAQMTNLRELNRLSLQENRLTGEIPDGIGKLSKLQRLYLNNNQLSGAVPSSIGRLASLEATLDFGGNQITGRIPSEVGFLTSLRGFTVENNKLIGRIPSEVGLLSNLRNFNAGSNQLSGRIPSEVGVLTSLRDLNAENNKLTGVLPSEIGPLGLANLETLKLGINSLSGPIPTSVGTLLSLKYLDLAYNKLTSTIPAVLPATLTDFSVEGNSLSGSLPTRLGLLTNLYVCFFFLNNGLTGTVPTELGLLTRLTQLFLDNTALSGTLPTELGRLTGVVKVNIANTRLSGTFPSFFCNLGMKSFDCSNTMCGCNTCECSSS